MAKDYTSSLLSSAACEFVDKDWPAIELVRVIGLQPSTP